MEIQPPPDLFARPTSGSRPTPINPAELLARLQSGQTLIAKVEKLLNNNEVELRIGNQSVRANSPIPLTAGQSINLVVEESNSGNILRITQQISQADLITRALRAVLPKQQPIADVVKQLVHTVTSNKTDSTPSQTSNPINNNLRTAIQTFVNNLPNVKTLSQADGVRQAIQNSGVNLESHLRQALISGKPINTTNDIKANFLRIAQSALQTQAKINIPPPNTTAGNNASGKVTSTENYNALISAAAKQVPPLTVKTDMANRPLLPPLTTVTPPPANKESSISQRLLASLPPLLQRLLPIQQPAITPHISSAQAVQQAQQSSPQLFSAMIVELLNQMESGLARIQQHQLNSLASDDIIRHVLGLELPVFNGKNFENIGVRIEWEDNTEKELKNPHQWRVVLNFDFDSIGKTQVIIRAGKDEIHTDFKSESNVAQQLFREHKDTLDAGFRKHGLTLGNTNFSMGKIEPQPSHAQSESLVKTKA